MQRENTRQDEDVSPEVVGGGGLTCAVDGRHRLDGIEDEGLVRVAVVYLSL